MVVWRYNRYSSMTESARNISNILVPVVITFRFVFIFFPHRRPPPVNSRPGAVGERRWCDRDGHIYTRAVRLRVPLVYPLRSMLTHAHTAHYRLFCSLWYCTVFRYTVPQQLVVYTVRAAFRSLYV